MANVIIDFRDLMDVQDEEITPLVQQIVEMRTDPEKFDPQLEHELIRTLEETLGRKLEDLMDPGLEMEQEEPTFERMSMEELLTYDIPQEIADDIDSLAVTRIDIEKNLKEYDENIYDRLMAMDMKEGRNIHDVYLSIDPKSLEIPEPEMERKLALSR